MSCKRLRVIHQTSPVTGPGCAAAFGASSAAHTQSEPWADHHDLSLSCECFKSERSSDIKVLRVTTSTQPGDMCGAPPHTHTHVLSNVCEVPKSFPHWRYCLRLGIKMSFHLSTLCFYSLSLCLLLFYLSPLSLSCPLSVSPPRLNVLFVSNLPAPPSPPPPHLHHHLSLSLPSSVLAPSPLVDWLFPITWALSSITL